MASGFTQKGKLEIAQQALDLITEANLKVMLVDDAYVHDNTRDFVDDGSADDAASHEIAVAGYTPGFGGAGRRVPASRVFNRDDAGLEIEFDFADIVWIGLGTGVTIGGAVLIVEKTSDADSWVVAFDDLAEDKPTNGGDMTYAPSAEGALKF